MEIFKEIQAKVQSATHGVVIDSKTFRDYYLPLGKHYINDRKEKKIKTYIIGIQGWPGTGKTVFAESIKFFLESMGYKVKGFSIDDFYKSNIERLRMARIYKGNPFYQISRGMPGTHNHIKLLDTLKKAKSGNYFELPVFDKSLHNGRGDVVDDVIKVSGRQDFILLEGWCVNMPYIKSDKFSLIMSQNAYANKIFKELDPKKEYFEVVMGYIKKYQKIWDLLDNRTLIAGENIELLEEWRAEQEERLIAAKGSGMTQEEIHEFVKPLIPFAYFSCEEISETGNRIDCIMTIGKGHIPERINIFA